MFQIQAKHGRNAKLFYLIIHVGICGIHGSRLIITAPGQVQYQKAQKVGRYKCASHNTGKSNPFFLEIIEVPANHINKDHRDKHQKNSKQIS